jgi:hypothetical protein
MQLPGVASAGLLCAGPDLHCCVLAHDCTAACCPPICTAVCWPTTVLLCAAPRFVLLCAGPGLYCCVLPPDLYCCVLPPDLYCCVLAQDCTAGALTLQLGQVKLQGPWGRAQQLLHLLGHALAPLQHSSSSSSTASTPQTGEVSSGVPVAPQAHTMASIPPASASGLTQFATCISAAATECNVKIRHYTMEATSFSSAIERRSKELL